MFLPLLLSPSPSPSLSPSLSPSPLSLSLSSLPLPLPLLSPSPSLSLGVYSELLFQTPAGVMLNSTVSVGTASDVLIEVYCVSSSSTDQPVWNGSDSLVSSPISTFGISQDYNDGGGGGNRTLLRIYPAAPFLSSKGSFICSSNGDTRTITFVNGKLYLLNYYTLPPPPPLLILYSW